MADVRRAAHHLLLEHRQELGLLEQPAHRRDMNPVRAAAPKSLSCGTQSEGRERLAALKVRLAGAAVLKADEDLGDELPRRVVAV